MKYRVSDVASHRPQLALPPCERIKVADVIAATVRAAGLSRRDLVSDRRHKTLVRWRQAAMEVAAQATQASTPQLGRSFRRDHTTVLWARYAVARRVASGCETTRFELAAICEALGTLMQEGGASIGGVGSVVTVARAPTKRPTRRDAEPACDAPPPAPRQVPQSQPVESTLSPTFDRNWWRDNDARFRAVMRNAYPELERAQ